MNSSLEKIVVKTEVHGLEMKTAMRAFIRTKFMLGAHGITKVEDLPRVSEGKIELTDNQGNIVKYVTISLEATEGEEITNNILVDIKSKLETEFPDFTFIIAIKEQ